MHGGKDGHVLLHGRDKVMPYIGSGHPKILNFRI